MEKNIISSKQASNIITLFMIGSSAITGVSGTAKQDGWIAFIFGTLMSIPLLLIYCRIVKLFPQKNLYEIVYELFGKIGGIIISILFVFYSIQLGAVVVRNFTEFIQITNLPQTPQYIMALFCVVTCLWILKHGLEVLGRISIIFVPFTLLVLAFTFIFLAKDMDINNIKPIFGQDLKLILSTSASVLTFPFGESVLFMVVLSSLPPKDNPCKVYFSGVLLGGLFLFVAIFRNVLTLGVPAMDIQYFPSYSAVSLLSLGTFITRIEIVVAANFLAAGIVKVCVCLYSSSVGIARIFKMKNYKLIIAPIAFFMIVFSQFAYTNTMEMFEFIKIYKYYAIPFQFIIPVIIYIFAEIKAHKNKKLAKCEEGC